MGNNEKPIKADRIERKKGILRRNRARVAACSINFAGKEKCEYFY